MRPFWSPSFENLNLWLLAQTPRVFNALEMTSIFAHLATFAAYAVIPLLIAYFLLRRRQVHFSWVWFLLVLYLLVGGAANLLYAFGEPVANWAAMMKVAQAFVSWIWVLV